MEQQLVTALTNALSAGGGTAQSACAVVIVWFLWKQNQQHREERELWNRRFDALANEQNRALNGNSEALRSLQVTIAELTAGRRK